MKVNELSINELADKEYDALVKYCLSRTGGDEQMARDCACEALLRAKKLGDPPKHPNISGWLRRTARNVAHEMLREKKEYARRNVSLDELSERTQAPFFARESAFLEDLWTDEPGDDDIERIKREILDSLIPGDRELIELAYEKKLPLAEIAERLGKSKDAVRVKLSRLTDRVTNLARAYFETDRKE